MRLPAFLALAAALACAPSIRAAGARLPPPEAMLVIVGDVHSAYDRVAQLVAEVDRLKAENRHVPLAVLINGDAFEYGNPVARRSHGEVDLAFFAALAKRAPTILNLGNHEADFFDPAELRAKIEATGVTVISGNGRSRATGQPLAPPSTVLKLGAHEATVVGVMTDQLAQFRAAIRPDLDLANPAVWAKQRFAALFREAPLPVVLSHSGMKPDTAMLAICPPGTLFAGAHDHLQFDVRLENRGVYFHSGSWLEVYSLAALRRNGQRLEWDVTRHALDAAGPGDPELVALVRRVRAEHLTPADTAVVGRLPKAMPVAEAAVFVATAAAKAAGAEVCFVGNTTFGAGLPAGSVTRADFDACVRFEGPLFTATVSGTRLQRCLSESRAESRARFLAGSGGEFNYAGGNPGQIDPARNYVIATSDWGAKNSDRYFGEPAIAWEQHPTVKLKAAALAALAKGK